MSVSSSQMQQSLSYSNQYNMFPSCSLLESAFPIRVTELTPGSVFVKVFLFLWCHLPYIQSYSFCLFSFLLHSSFPMFIFVFRCHLSPQKRRHTNEWSAKSHRKGCFCLLSHCSTPVITTFVCALCLQEKGKADGNIDQCEYTYCV